MSGWKPKEIIVHEEVKNDPVTLHFIEQCEDTPVRYINNSKAKTVIGASRILSNAGNKMIEKIIAGKQVVFIAPANNAVDIFDMPDNRFACPHFDRLKLASNGCFYQCDWCYLKLTYRSAFPFMTIRAQYDRIIEQIEKRLRRSDKPVMFNSGELADSLSMEHLTNAGRSFIPWFAQTENGYLFMLTKSDNVDGILDLQHNGHTVIAWSMNNENVSREFEIGAPSFERRLIAAKKVQDAGYPLRIRLDPIVPINGWQEAYAETIGQIFLKISPERMTIGILRFEEGFYKMRNTILTTGLRRYIEGMVPMFEPMILSGFKKAKSGKYSFPFNKRLEIFDFIIRRIRKHSDCKIALCKESHEMWDRLGLDLGRLSCVCQLDYADLDRF